MPKAGSQPNQQGSSVHGAVQPNFGEVRIRQRGRLPHWEKDSGLYFITFHLADSLPHAVLKKLIARNRVLVTAKRAGAHLVPSQKVMLDEFSSAKMEEFFDRGAGACLMQDPRIAELMASTLQFWHGKRYRLEAWCVMPNHVHVVCRLFPGQQLATVLRSWKSYSARTANSMLGRSGIFWQREYYDRLIRDEDEFARAVRYVVNNPKRAGLKNWKWVWCAGEDARTTAGLESGATG